MPNDERGLIEGYVLPPGDGIGAPFVKAGQAQTGGAFCFLELSSEPGRPPVPPHVHLNEDEYFYIAEGELLFHVDGNSGRAGCGTFVKIQRGTVHSHEHSGNARTRYLAIFSPAGVEGFFVERAVRGIGWGSAEEKNLGLKYGIEFTDKAGADSRSLPPRDGVA